MTELTAGKNIEEAKAMAETFIRVMRGEESADILDEWGDIMALKGVIQYPVRVKCATLAWHALIDELS